MQTETLCQKALNDLATQTKKTLNRIPKIQAMLLYFSSQKVRSEVRAQSKLIAAPIDWKG